MNRSELKRLLLARIDYTAEFDKLLGKGRGNKRQCWNRAAHSNDDKSHSLSFNPSHGGWKCHGCGETGDIFTLHEKVRGESFAVVYERLLKEHGLWKDVVDFRKKTGKARKARSIKDPNVKGKINTAMQKWKTKRGKELLTFMYNRYGLTEETLMYYRIGIHTNRRVSIPIWSYTSRHPRNDHMIPDIVNVRYHDAFRNHCSWINTETKQVHPGRGRPEEVTDEKIIEGRTQPWVTAYKKAGKVINVRGYGGAYPYPCQVMSENSTLWLVGGEFKALLLNQLGIPAFCFTSGEGAFNENIIPYLIGKRVNVLFDADPDKKVGDDGLRNIDRIARDMAQRLANEGVDAAWGWWPEEIRQILPPGGDVTDLLRTMLWDPQALDVIEWRRCFRQTDDQTEKEAATVSGAVRIPKFGEMKKVHLNDVTSPAFFNQWIKFEAMVAGRVEVPYVVHTGATATCETGRQTMQVQCANCSLPSCGFKKSVYFDISAQIEHVRAPAKALEKEVRRKLGIPASCKLPDIKPHASASEILTLVPTINAQEGNSDPSKSLYITQKVYTLDGENMSRMKDNHSYKIGGQVIMDPKGGFYTLAATSWERVSNDVFSFRYHPETHGRLMAATRQDKKTVNEQMDAMLGEVRDHIVDAIFGADTMLTAMWLSLFMPFTFRIGSQRQDRICPAVMILGDTNTGKSTTWKRLMAFYESGRLVAGDSRPTIAGLLGGSVSTGKRAEFMWGVLPNSNGGVVAIDEYNKLPKETIGSLTNTLSSGIAERRIVGMTKRAPCWVRLLYMCNPRGERRLTSYDNMMHAALGAAGGTVQDLGRIDMVVVQPPVKDLSAFTMKAGRHKIERKYTQTLGKWHLSWAWTRKPGDFHFQDPKYVFDKAIELATKLRSNTVMLPAQARFKLARLAAAVASALFSTGPKAKTVHITNEHVNWAYRFFLRLYLPYIASHNSAVVAMPSNLAAWLDKCVKSAELMRLRLLASGARRFSMDDFMEVFLNKPKAIQFLNLVYFEHRLMSKRSGWYVPEDQLSFSEMFGDYITERERSESQHKGNSNAKWS